MTTPLLIITATGNRPSAFALCEKWMAAQTYAGPRLWLVIDDGKVPTACTMGQTVVHRTPGTWEPPHTLALNIREAVPYIRDAERVLFWEDDDFYGPRYIETMMGWLDAAPLVGEVGAKYYHVGQQAYRHFTNHTHASLCRTGFNAEVLPVFLKALDYCLARKTPMIDLKLWGYWTGPTHKFRDTVGDARLCVGIKGMPGRASNNHNRADYIPDPDLAMLKLWVGDDHTAYLPFLGGAEAAKPDPPQHRVIRLPRRAVQPPDPVTPLIVYSAILGGYDRLATAVKAPGVRYVCFGDGKDRSAANGWEVVHVGPTPDPVSKVRFFKMHPHVLFPDAERSLWVDGSFQFRVNPNRLLAGAGDAEIYLARHPQRDCIMQEAAECLRLGRSGVETSEQALTYIAAGHPEHWGLYCGGMIYRRHTDAVKRFDEAWWAEFEKWHKLGASRDQISLAHVLRTSGVPFASFNRNELGKYARLRPHAVITPQRRAAERATRPNYVTR